MTADNARTGHEIERAPERIIPDEILPPRRSSPWHPIGFNEWMASRPIDTTCRILEQCRPGFHYSNPWFYFDGVELVVNAAHVRITKLTES